MSLVVLAPFSVQTPYLRLGDNLEEPSNLGFCIDLKGWNPPTFTNAQTHSCKPTDGSAGGGTDEEFEPRDGAVRGRADAHGRCLQAKSATAGAALDVPLCESEEPLQSFVWDAAAGTLTLAGGGGLCLAAGATLRQANSFWARDLELADCAATDATLLTWRVEGAAASHNCMTREMWSAEKTAWCCANQQLGCPAPPSPPPTPPPPAGLTTGVLIAIVAAVVIVFAILALSVLAVRRGLCGTKSRAAAGAGGKAADVALEGA